MLRLPFPSESWGVFQAWHIEIALFTAISFLPSFLLGRWRKSLFLIASILVATLIFSVEFVGILLASFVIFYFATEFLASSFVAKQWQVKHRVFLAWFLLLFMLGVHWLLVYFAIFDLYAIAHWAGIAYGLPRLADWFSARMEGRIKQGKINDFLLYMFYFPSFMQGPIARADEFASAQNQQVNKRKVANAFFLLFEGYVKYALALALFFSRPPGFFSSELSASNAETLLFVVLTPVIGYLFFAAYTDTARGFSLLLGINLPENFANPFATVSLRKFWRRYHMSLTFWLRDFVYIPLGGNRRNRVVNVFVVFAFIWLWHAPSAGFFAWAFLQGVGVSVEQVLSRQSIVKNKLFLPVNFIIFWIWQGVSWSFFYGGFDGAVAVWRRVFM